MATLRWDGFVSLDASEQPAELVTKPLRFQGKRLEVNLDAPNGTLKAEIQDASGKPIDGFSLEDCIGVRGDGVSLPVRWKGDENLAELTGRAVRLRFRMEGGAWYGFRFA